MENNACPDCGGPVSYDLACHTWPQTQDERTTWMSCMLCDSATWWTCCAHNERRCNYPPDCVEGYHEGCGWTWTQGLNPDNPRASDNETRNPHWDD